MESVSNQTSLHYLWDLCKQFHALARDTFTQEIPAAFRDMSFLTKALTLFDDKEADKDPESEEKMCSICFDDDVPIDNLSITSCAHVFHTDCLEAVIATAKAKGDMYRSSYGLASRMTAPKFACPLCRELLNPFKDVHDFQRELESFKPKEVCPVATTDVSGDVIMEDVPSSSSSASKSSNTNANEA